jgi:hypothetical protein
MSRTFLSCHFPIQLVLFVLADVSLAFGLGRLAAPPLITPTTPGLLQHPLLALPNHDKGLTIIYRTPLNLLSRPEFETGICFYPTHTQSVLS